VTKIRNFNFAAQLTPFYEQPMVRFREFVLLLLNTAKLLTLHSDFHVAQ